jgi:hypothetical protein
MEEVSAASVPRGENAAPASPERCGLLASQGSQRVEGRDASMPPSDGRISPSGDPGDPHAARVWLGVEP